MGERPQYRTIVFDSTRWDLYTPRSDDIVISTPAKAGTTWMQMLCALLIFQRTELDGPLEEISPWLDMTVRSRDEVKATLEAQQHRRFIKSHTPLDGIPWSPTITYICVGRDPRDVALSWFNHFDNMNFVRLFEEIGKVLSEEEVGELLAGGMPPPPPSDLTERFWQWVEEDDASSGFNLAGMIHHLRTFWDRRDEPNVALFHYHDMKRDLDGEMRRLAAVLGIAVADDVWPSLVEAAGFSSMRDRASELAPGASRGHWQSDEGFFHKGTSGQWTDILDPGDERYAARIASLCAPDLAAFAHKGWGALDATARA